MGALRIARQLGIGGMRCAVEFDDESLLAAAKIRETGADRLLPHEFRAGQLTVAEF